MILLIKEWRNNIKTKWDTASATKYVEKCEKNGTTGIKYWGAKDFLTKAKADKLIQENEEDK